MAKKKVTNKEKRDKWVKKRIVLDKRGFIGEEVQVVDDSVWDETGDKSPKLVLRFNKYWAVAKDEFENSAYKIKTPEKWFDIKEKVETEAFPELGWNIDSSELKKLADQKKAKIEIHDEIQKIVDLNPTLYQKLLENTDVSNLSEGNIDFLSEVIKTMDNKILDASESVQSSFKTVVNKISSSDKEGIRKLEGLLEKWRLLNLTSVSSILLRRLNTMSLFEEMIMKDETYEIRGENSIHRMLEKNMWLLDENYWLMQSNRTLRTFIGEQILKKHKSVEKKRPDFVCCTKDKKLILVEIKKPSLTIGKEEIDQIEKYSIVAEEYKSKEFTKIDSFLIGNKLNSEAKSLIKRRQGLKFMTYNELIEKTKYVYQEYLKKLEEIENNQLSK